MVKLAPPRGGFQRCSSFLPPSHHHLLHKAIMQLSGADLKRPLLSTKGPPLQTRLCFSSTKNCITFLCLCWNPKKVWRSFPSNTPYRRRMGSLVATSIEIGPRRFQFSFRSLFGRDPGEFQSTFFSSWKLCFLRTFI